MIQSSKLFLKTPPAPAKPGFPMEELSVLSFKLENRKAKREPELNCFRTQPENVLKILNGVLKEGTRSAGNNVLVAEKGISG
ncbi:hypothetical protein ACH5RR_016100 [Cinchona calisaya]|uniref:Uncharacterized protein n=1 Tax=Cinchona calisaya TaxID=153742 RepID=A0ABD2ZV20_9GENT